LANEEQSIDQVYKTITPKVKYDSQKIHPRDGVMFSEKCFDVFDIAVRTDAEK
jgi:hypothetical protein